MLIYYKKKKNNDIKEIKLGLNVNVLLIYINSIIFEKIWIFLDILQIVQLHFTFWIFHRFSAFETLGISNFNLKRLFKSVIILNVTIIRHNFKLQLFNVRITRKSYVTQMGFGAVDVSCLIPINRKKNFLLICYLKSKKYILTN